MTPFTWGLTSEDFESDGAPAEQGLDRNRSPLDDDETDLRRPPLPALVLGVRLRAARDYRKGYRQSEAHAGGNRSH